MVDPDGRLGDGGSVAAGQARARPRVVVVGAGIAGLMCARQLTSAGVGVVVVDKGRGVGGRMATRRFGGAVFDHGAQYFTARPPWFTTEVQGWESSGVVSSWFDSGGSAWRGVPSMTAVAKHLARGCDVRVSTAVTAVSPGDASPWRVAVMAGGAGGGEPGTRAGEPGTRADEVALDADAVVVTAPVPQALALLDAGGVVLGTDVTRRLAAVTYDPCLAVLAVLDGPSGMTAPGWWRLGDGGGDGDARGGADGSIGGSAGGDPGGIVAWVADNQLKGISEVPALTVHCTTDASVAMFDEDADDVIATVLDAVGQLPGHPGGGREVVASQLVRWRYARVATADPGPCLVTDVEGAGPLVVAGDGFGGPRVQSAAQSGLAAAHQLIARWSDVVGSGS
jgi:predicted NAD/FAD-dependent oxidoreductase